MSEPQQQQQGEQAGGEQQESVTITLSPASGGQQATQETPVASRFVSTVSRMKEGMLERPIRYDIISILFTLLILGGGIYGYLTKDSVPSLVAGIVFGILLAFGTYLEGARKNPYPLIITLAIVGVQFAYRYGQSMKFMPSGLFAILTLIMVARHCFLVYLKRKHSLDSVETPTGEP